MVRKTMELRQSRFVRGGWAARGYSDGGEWEFGKTMIPIHCSSSTNFVITMILIVLPFILF